MCTKNMNNELANYLDKRYKGYRQYKTNLTHTVPTPTNEREATVSSEKLEELTYVSGENAPVGIGKMYPWHPPDEILDYNKWNDEASRSLRDLLNNRMGEELNDNKINDIIGLVLTELNKADKKYPPMAEKIEGLCTLKCEVMELEREVIRLNHDAEAMEKEAIQVVAMAIKFIRDCCY